MVDAAKSRTVGADRWFDSNHPCQINKGENMQIDRIVIERQPKGDYFLYINKSNGDYKEQERMWLFFETDKQHILSALNDIKLITDKKINAYCQSLEDK